MKRNVQSSWKILLKKRTRNPAGRRNKMDKEKIMGSLCKFDTIYPITFNKMHFQQLGNNPTGSVEIRMDEDDFVNFVNYMLKKHTQKRGKTS